MKIAFIGCSSVPFGANDLLYYQAAERLVAGGHSILVSMPDWRADSSPRYDILASGGAKLHRRPFDIRSSNIVTRQWQKAKHKLSDKSKIWTDLTNFDPSVIAISDAATYGFIAEGGLVEFLMRMDRPFVTISNGNYENSYLEQDRLLRARVVFDRARACVFVSHRNLEVARRQLCLPLRQAVVVDPPPNLSSFEAQPWPASDCAKFAMVARLEAGGKGQALTLQMLASEEWLGRDWRLNLFGQGSDELYLRDLIAFLGLDGRVALRGHVDDVRTIWAEHHLLIMASSHEGKPLALSEAMICGRPAVVTDVGGNAELIEDGVTGFVAESAALKSLGIAMNRAWEHKACWEDMGVKAHRFMTKRLQPPPDERLATLLVQLASPR